MTSKEVMMTSIFKEFGQKYHIFEGESCFKFSNFVLALRMTFKFSSSVVKGLKLKARESCGLILTRIN